MTSSVVGPSGPRPGVERAIAETIRAHEFSVKATPPSARMDCICGEGYTGLLSVERALDLGIAHLAAAIVAAIPSLPVEALAELVGGEVERAVQGFPSSGMSEVPTMPLLTEPTHTRVVTPWRSVTSPEGES